MKIWSLNHFTEKDCFLPLTNKLFYIKLIYFLEPNTERVAKNFLKNKSDGLNSS